MTNSSTNIPTVKLNSLPIRSMTHSGKMCKLTPQFWERNSIWSELATVSTSLMRLPVPKEDFIRENKVMQMLPITWIGWFTLTITTRNQRRAESRNGSSTQYLTKVQNMIWVQIWIYHRFTQSVLTRAKTQNRTKRPRWPKSLHTKSGLESNIVTIKEGNSIPIMG